MVGLRQPGGEHHSEELVENHDVQTSLRGVGGKTTMYRETKQEQGQIKERDKPTPTVKKINVMQLTYRLTNSNEKQKAQTMQLNEEF
jgi:hypothetical protein